MRTRYLLISLLTTLTLGLSGCETAGDQPKSDGGNASSSVESIDLKAMDEAAAEAEVSLEELYEELDEIDLGFLGAVSVSDDVSGKVGAQGLFDKGIADRIIEVLDKAVVKFEGLVDKLRGKVDDVRAKILTEMAKLDPTNPAHIALMAQLQKLLDRVDQLEARLDDALDRLSEKVGLLTDKVDDLIARLDMGNPLHWIAMAELNKIKFYLLEVQDRIAQI